MAKLMKSRVVRPNELAERLGVARTTLWRWQREGRLPSPQLVGPNVRGWLEADLDQWWEARSGVPVANDETQGAEG
jgi:excisionase family DNA binding protein